MQPVQNDQTLMNELVRVQSTPETGKNDPCYSSDTTTITRKADVFILQVGEVNDVIKATLLEMIDSTVKSNPLTLGL